ncbi:5-methyltetrahydropteroyltriglutamate--homocysteine methyltransferase-like isoform X2 [Camellia sinensis]|nr:5-methyltetrahydropteroyltriglutamate--homocysteine methyltransferase-like isoform X2 [Camellia sinensis]XP_028055807.1 5-methyltetrahydropteroyltriglutamate--homocysteine methyltransferase-like isoform X2 [Camellia sinensis]
MASHIGGCPPMGPEGGLKFALESFWDKKRSAEDLKKDAAYLRSSIWKQMASAGIKYIPSNTFSYYDQVLDTTVMLGAVPPRYGWTSGEIGFDTYFSMARGNASVPAMEMTKWFDTNYCFIVPELGPEIKFSYASHKAVDEYKEAKALGVDTVPVLVGPVSYLLLSKPAKGVEESFSLLSLLDKILPIYKEVVGELKAAGASWIQFDEPTLVMKDLESHQLQAFTAAYSGLESALSGLNVIVETYFADVPAEAFETLTSLKCVTGFGFDLVRGAQTLDLITSGFPSEKYLFAGVVDGRNIWANDLAAPLSLLQTLEGIVGKDKLVVSTSCWLHHTVDLVNETPFDKELKSWLAFAAQKVVEVNSLAKALAGHKDERPIIFGGVSRQKAMKGKLTGSMPLLDRFETSHQAIKDEVVEDPQAGVTDTATDTTQIHTHTCCVHDIIQMIIHSDEELLFSEGMKYGAGIGSGADKKVFWEVGKKSTFWLFGFFSGFMAKKLTFLTKKTAFLAKKPAFLCGKTKKPKN